ncbi:tyrosine-type recombinase/integrase [Campylobacter fetus]|uniref:tyrosine-type recombinase/integrase n=1 Tax=Campylobacter fetus TaxID=196 RepID=UPI00164FFF79|nr:site-specific integrase [Campylobacter fetus]
MKFYDRNGILWVDYTINKRRVRKSLGVTYNKENIANYTYSLKKELEKAPNLLSAKDVSFEFFKNRILKWISTNKKRNSYKNYKALYNIFARFFSINDIRKISAYDIELGIYEMQKQGLANRSIKSVLSVVSMAFNEAIKDGVIYNNPVKLAKKPICKRKVYPSFNDEQVRELLANANGNLKKFLYIAFYTGARAGEILGLTWQDIDFKNNKIYIKRARQGVKGVVMDTPKNGERTIYLLEPLKEFLQGYIQNKDSFMIKVSYFSILYKFKKLIKELGLEDTGLHSTRRTFIRLAMKKNIDLALIQLMVGHRDLDMINKVYSGYTKDYKDVDTLNQAFCV